MYNNNNRIKWLELPTKLIRKTLISSEIALRAMESSILSTKDSVEPCIQAITSKMLPSISALPTQPLINLVNFKVVRTGIKRR
jgi:hypothetical protein